MELSTYTPLEEWGICSNMNKPNQITELFKQVAGLLFRIVQYIFRRLGLILKRLRKLFRFSITFKITVVYSFIFIMLLSGITISILGITGYFLYNEAENSIEKTLTLVEERTFVSYEALEEGLAKLANDEELIVRIYDRRDRQIFTTEEDLLVENHQGIISPIEKRTAMEVEEEIFNLRLYDPFTKELKYIELVFFFLLIINLASWVVIIIYGSKATRRMLSPIERMTETVKRISISDLNTRLDVSGSQDELKELAETFNEMLDRIEASYQQQNQFVSDASHELRTPISVLQGYANLLDRWGKEDKDVLDESILAIKGESENMKSLVERLLFLARTDKNLQRLEREEFSMDELVSEVLRDANIIDSQHQFEVLTNEDTIYYGDRKLIKQLLRILLDNSIKFTPQGGIISINNKRTKNLIILEIADTGPGIAQEDLPHIFERFYRADKSRSKNQGGQGLGLSIAKWIVDSHHGKIEVKSKLGRGTKFIIYLPYGLKEYYKTKGL